MATAKQAVAAIAAAVEGTALAPGAMASDLALDREAIPAGATRYQLQAWAGPSSTHDDSNENFLPALAVRLAIHHHLGENEAERDFTQDEMQDFLEVVLDPDFWDDLPEVHNVDEAPELALSDVTRVGRVISFIVTTVVTVDIYA